MSSQKFKVFEDCRFIKGFCRSLIYDLSRNTYTFIPNSLFEIIEKWNGYTVDEIKKSYNNEYDDTIDEYFNFLLENEFIFYTDNPEFFTKLDLSWHSNSLITNAIICEGHLLHDFKSISESLEELNCKSIQLRFFYEVRLQRLIDVLIHFAHSQIKDIEIIMPFNHLFDDHTLLSIVEKNPRITSFHFFSANDNSIVFLDEAKKLPIYNTTKTISDNSFCGVIHPKNFKINTKFYCESIQYNCCLNQKISIDTNGDIKNCPSCKNNFGNIKDFSLKHVVQDDDFRKLWHIKKDMIDVCSSCEFRYMCMDCRAYIKDSSNVYSQPSKCTYNPYIAKWKDQDGYISVEEWNSKNN